MICGLKIDGAFLRDFTLESYKKLLISIKTAGYSFQTLQDFIQQPEDKTVILRHDVDRLPWNALVIAKIEKDAGIRASYYFRIVKESYDEDIIRQIAEMVHEIVYHYENLAEISRKKEGRISHRRKETEIRGRRSEVRRARARDRDPQTRLPLQGTSGQVTQITQIDTDEGKKEFRDELFELAICDFERNLEKFRKLYPVKTICMHGSPLSKWDNRDLWKRYNYRDFGIIAEPYFDIDYDEVFYITDTGRAWNNSKVSVRDKVASRFDIDIKSGLHLIELILKNKLPDKIMLNVHPQRWFDYGYNWYKELLMQNVKNVVKRLMLKLRD